MADVPQDHQRSVVAVAAGFGARVVNVIASTVFKQQVRYATGEILRVILERNAHPRKVAADLAITPIGRVLQHVGIRRCWITVNFVLDQLSSGRRVDRLLINIDLINAVNAAFG